MTEKNLSKKRIEGCDNIRVLAMFLVILGHCLSLALTSGGVVSERIDPYKGLTLAAADTAFRITVIIYSFHMPLFTALSGSVYALSRKEEDAFLPYAKLRIKRLLIPYLMTAVFLWIPVRTIFGAYSHCVSLYDYLKQAFFWNVLLTRNIGYLWFCPALLEINLLGFLIRKKLWPSRTGQKALFWAVLLICSAGSAAFPYNVLQLREMMRLLIWYCLGIWIMENRQSLARFVNRKALLTSAVLFAALTAGHALAAPALSRAEGSARFFAQLTEQGMTYAIALSGIILFYILGFLLGHVKSFAPFIPNAFSIYLFSVPFGDLFVFLASRKVSPESLNNLTCWAMMGAKTAVSLIGAMGLILLLGKLRGRRSI